MAKVPAHPYIKIETTAGDIVLELDGRRAPLTVQNFLNLTDDGYFDGTIFHRVIPAASFCRWLDSFLSVPAPARVGLGVLARRHSPFGS